MIIPVKYIYEIQFISWSIIVFICIFLNIDLGHKPLHPRIYMQRGLISNYIFCGYEELYQM